MNDRHKNNKILYYAINFARQLIPASIYRARLNKKLSGLSAYDANYIWKRVNYYNKLECNKTLSASVLSLNTFKLTRKFKVYFFDAYEHTRYFEPKFRIKFVFGDVIEVPEEPAVVKSRPLSGDNTNSVLLKLNKVRHFTFTNDRKYFRDKINQLVWRGTVKQPHRLAFFEKHFKNSLCDIGKINRGGQTDQWLKQKMTIDEQLDFKFILCLEGYDVASNLKWVMSSNSVAVMPKPKYETWFMEGTLIPDFHYVLIKDDFSDLDVKLKYFMTHPEEAIQIARNANQYCEAFKDKKREELISLLVIQKYLLKTCQLDVAV